MCTETFLRLPEEKRRRFLDAAWEEFTAARFTDVSINQIVRRAGIPRGSFYQYFADKTDLFRHLLRCYDRQLEDAIRISLDRCGGRPLELPLALYDLVLSHVQERRDEFSLFLGILRQNMGMDAGQLLSLPEMVVLVLEEADWSGLTLDGQEERLALLDLLLSAAGQALMAACCGKLTPEESRARLALKTALIRRGAEPEEPLE